MRKINTTVVEKYYILEENYAEFSVNPITSYIMWRFCIKLSKDQIVLFTRSDNAYLKFVYKSKNLSPPFKMKKIKNG